MRDKKAIGCQFNIFFVLKVIILFYWLKKYKNINLSPINIITKKIVTSQKTKLPLVTNSLILFGNGERVILLFQSTMMFFWCIF